MPSRSVLNHSCSYNGFKFYYVVIKNWAKLNGYLNCLLDSIVFLLSDSKQLSFGYTRSWPSPHHYSILHGCPTLCSLFYLLLDFLIWFHLKLVVRLISYVKVLLFFASRYIFKWSNNNWSFCRHYIVFCFTLQDLVSQKWRLY